MAVKEKSFEIYARECERQNYVQFKGNNFKGGRTFVIAVADAGVLQKELNCQATRLGSLKMHESVIVTRKGGHKELWTNPHLPKYREIHLAFFAEVGISVPAAIAAGYDSDHAFAASAASPAVGLVKMSFIPRGANRSFGAGFEKRFTHRTLNGYGLCMGNLFDLYKSVGGRFLLPRDPAGCGRAIVEDLIIRGIAPEADRKSLEREAQAVMDYIQDQDTAYATDPAAPQVDLREGRPLLPQ